jgi:hypothetical protein
LEYIESIIAQKALEYIDFSDCKAIAVFKMGYITAVNDIFEGKLKLTTAGNGTTAQMGKEKT